MAVELQKSREHTIYFCAEPWLKGDEYFVRVVADSYEQLRVILFNNYYFLQGIDYVVVDRSDGSLVSCEADFQSLRPDCDLLVITANNDRAKYYGIFCGSDIESEELEPTTPKRARTVPEAQHDEQYYYQKKQKKLQELQQQHMDFLVHTSNFFVSKLQISQIEGNAEMGGPNQVTRVETKPLPLSFNARPQTYKESKVPSFDEFVYRLQDSKKSWKKHTLVGR